ncbi:MerR family transcriptional regulator [Flindersiella endophytica]
MRIGELAQRTGATTRALRYYESQGLLSPDRRRNGYRTYDESDVVRVGNIRHLLALGLPSEAIKPFLLCDADGDVRVAPACEEWVRVAQLRLSELDERIAELHVVRDRLARTVARRRAELFGVGNSEAE